MKKIVLITAIAVFTTVAAQAQLWISANLGFNTNSGSNKKVMGSTTTETDLPKTSSYHFMPTIGYNLSDNICIGLGIGYNGSTNTDEDIYVIGDKETIKYGGFKVMPFARYIGKINDNFGWYAQGDLGYGSGKETTSYSGGGTTNTDDTKTSSLGFNIRPGVYYQFSDHFSMNTHYGQLGYNSWNSKSGDTTTVENTDKNSSFGLNLNMSTLGFGLNYHF